MRITIEQGEPETIDTELLILGTYEEGMGKTAKKIDEALDHELKRAMEKKEFTGELGQIKILSTAGKFKARNVLIVGLGKRKESTIGTLRRAIGMATRIARDTIGVKNFVTTIHKNTTKDKNTIHEKIQAITEALFLGLYQFTKYKTQDTEKFKEIETIKLFVENKKEEMEEALKKGIIIGETTNKVRDLVNESGSELNPKKYADIMEEEAKKHEIKTTILDKKKIQEKKMTGLLAVNRGSRHEPRFVILEYGQEHPDSIALVGKGVTFDSGGLDIKTAAGMETMKADMAGSATIFGTIIAAARLKLPLHIYAVLGLTENMPGDDAYKPGDVVKAYNGKTIEILNTDAEGRITLADSLAYAEKELKPDAIIDAATLTGACVAALGSVAAAALGDKEIIEKIRDASKTAGEKIWELPLWPEYMQQVESEVADVRNMGIYAREAGTIMGAAFLKNFIEKTPWAHIDIAGKAYTTTEKELTKKGGTGWGVKLLTTMLEQWK